MSRSLRKGNRNERMADKLRRTKLCYPVTLSRRSARMADKLLYPVAPSRRSNRMADKLCRRLLYPVTFGRAGKKNGSRPDRKADKPGGRLSGEAYCRTGKNLVTLAIGEKKMLCTN